MRCECEHAAHFEKDARTPNGNPGHKYTAEFTNVSIVQLTYGKFKLCNDCKEDCMDAFCKTHFLDGCDC